MRVSSVNYVTKYKFKFVVTRLIMRCQKIPNQDCRQRSRSSHSLFLYPYVEDKDVELSFYFSNFPFVVFVKKIIYLKNNEKQITVNAVLERPITLFEGVVLFGRGGGRSNTAFAIIKDVFLIKFYSILQFFPSSWFHKAPIMMKKSD